MNETLITECYLNAMYDCEWGAVFLNKLICRSVPKHRECDIFISMSGDWVSSQESSIMPYLLDCSSSL